MPTSTTSPLSSFIRFGNDIQARATALIAETNERISNAGDRLNRVKAEAVAYLDRLDDVRVTAYERSARPFLHLYATLGKRMPGNAPTHCQGQRLLKRLPVFTASVSLSNRMRAIFGGVVGGVIVGLAVFIFSSKLTPEFPMLSAVGSAIFSGILFTMLAGYQAAKKNYSAACEYAEKAASFEKSVDDFSGSLKAIISMSQKSTGDIEELSSHTRTVVEQLTVIVRDSANAASLLRKILEMPILDGEGALLSGVVEQLNERKRDVHGLSLQLSGDVELISEAKSDIDETGLLLANRL